MDSTQATRYDIATTIDYLVNLTKAFAATAIDGD
jgi:hypothetical protein